MRLSIAFCLLLLLTTAGQAFADDHERLSGNWIIESFSVCGYQVRSSDADSAMTLSIAKSKMTFTPDIVYSWNFQINGSSIFDIKKSSSVTLEINEASVKKSYQLIENTDPAQIDIELPSEKSKTKERKFSKAIYRFIDDRLEICIGDPSYRPTDFTASKRNRLLQLVKQTEGEKKPLSNE